MKRLSTTREPAPTSLLTKFWLDNFNVKNAPKRTPAAAKRSAMAPYGHKLIFTIKNEFKDPKMAQYYQGQLWRQLWIGESCIGNRSD
jgi:hypothetical protein